MRLGGQKVILGLQISLLKLPPIRALFLNIDVDEWAEFTRNPAILQTNGTDLQVSRGVKRVQFPGRWVRVGYGWGTGGGFWNLGVGGKVRPTYFV